jgi:hypothetical protein
MSWLIELRKKLHQIPESAFEEHHSSALLREQLNILVKNHLSPEAIRAGSVGPLVHGFENSSGFWWNTPATTVPTECLERTWTPYRSRRIQPAISSRKGLA